MARPESSTTGACSPHSRCYRFRICPACAAIRQAHFANRAERLEALCGPLWYSVVTVAENTARALARAKRRWRDHHQPEAAIWSVELDPLARNLHLNLLHPVRQGMAPSARAAYCEPINGSARIVAAYITKPGHYPPVSMWPGPIAGTLGPLRPYLQARASHAVVAAASVNAALAPRDLGAAPPPPFALDHPPKALTMDDYRAIAATHLPGLIAALALAGRAAARPAR